jgi:hypothetical protein
MQNAVGPRNSRTLLSRAKRTTTKTQKQQFVDDIADFASLMTPEAGLTRCCESHPRSAEERKGDNLMPVDFFTEQQAPPQRRR